ncbi:MAG: glycosyltransferase [Pseudomonadota bacterium]
MTDIPKVLCDVTQSYAATGGGIRTYLTEKRRWLTENTPHRHVLIVPGDIDRVIDKGRHSIVEIKSPQVPGSPEYKLLLRSNAVIRALRNFRPASVECLDAYNLPWAALSYRRERPSTVLVAGYRTDFPTVYLDAPVRRRIGAWAAVPLRKAGYTYAARLYSRFDGLYALNADMASRLSALIDGPVGQLPLGVDTSVFSPAARDDTLRAELGATPDRPVLVYAGRLDGEKQADVVVEAFARLPESMRAVLVLLGKGNLTETIAERVRSEGLSIHMPGFVSRREDLARYLASADMYVSAMAHETFGISIIEAQAAGLPIIGVKAGAMPDRVPAGTGFLGAQDDPQEMCDLIVRLWSSGETAKVGAAGRAHVMARFGWDRTFETLFGSIYRNAEIASARRRGVEPPTAEPAAVQPLA